MFLYTNNATSTLAANIAATDTSLNVVAGHGARFPSPGTGEWFHFMISNSAAAYEYVKCTSRVGDVLTVARGKGGTTGVAWNSGDAVELVHIADDFDYLIKQDMAPIWGGTAGGTADALTCTLAPVPQKIGDLRLIALKANFDNTSATPTLNVNGLGAVTIIKESNSALLAGDIKQNMHHVFLYNGVSFTLLNPNKPTISGFLPLSGGTLTGALTLSDDANAELTAVPIPECGRLDYVSATQIKFLPHKGNRAMVKVAGKWRLRTIPAGGVLASNTALGTPPSYIDGVATNLAPNTTYYDYIRDLAGVLTHDFSLTGHATDADTGVEIKSGDATRTLVGMARTDASGQFVDSATNRQVASWFNRRPRMLLHSPGTITLSSLTPFELARITWLSWGDAVQLTGMGYGSTNAVNIQFVLGFGLDSATTETETISQYQSDSAIGYFRQATPVYAWVPPEGLRFATLLGRVNTSNVAMNNRVISALAML